MLSVKALAEAVAGLVTAEQSVARSAVLRVRALGDEVDQGEDEPSIEPAPGPGPGRGPGRGPPFWPPPLTKTPGGVITSTPPRFWTLHPTTLTSTVSVPASQQSSPTHDTLVTDLTTAMPTTAPSPTTLTDGITSSSIASSETSASSSQDASGLSSNRTLIITLSTVLSVVGVLLIAGGVMICLKYRRRRLPRFARGISPIDDDEIETWKMSRNEKASFASAAAAAAAAAGPSQAKPGHAKHTSTSSIKKPPSVIIYPNRQSQTIPRPSGEGSPRSIRTSYAPDGRPSLDKDLPKTPVQAVAPNARAGLTDEAVPGDDPFLPGPRRHPSRLSKAPPISSSRSVRSHRRARSSRSSMRSFGDYGSEMELSPRGSHECLNTHHRSNSRVYLSSAVPPRLSLGDDVHTGGLSPRPLFRENEIGRAIG